MVKRDMTGQTFLIFRPWRCVPIDWLHQEAAGRDVESAPVLLIGDPPAVHLKKMARGSQRLADAGDVGGGGGVDGGENWRSVRLSRALAGGVELSL